MIYLYLSLAFALLDWLVVAVEKREIEYFAKPAVMIFLIIWFITKIPETRGGLSILIMAGLILSLVGDVFLMLPGNWFLAGLIAFLLAHLAYIGAFNAAGFTSQGKGLLFALAILLVAIPIYLRIRTGLIAGRHQSLILPVSIYVIVISFMVFSASTTFFKSDWPLQAAMFVTVGAVLFFASDAVLAWNRFVTPITKGNLIVIIPYHLAQVLIAAGTLLKLGAL